MNKYIFDKKSGSFQFGTNSHSIWSSKNVLWVCLGCVSIFLLFAIDKWDIWTRATSCNIPANYHYCDLVTDDYVFVYPSYMSLSHSIMGTTKLVVNESNYITIESWDYNGENIRDMFNSDKNGCDNIVYTRCKESSNWYVITGYHDVSRAYYKKIALNKNGTKWIKAEFKFEKGKKDAFDKPILEYCFRRFPIRRKNE